MPTVAGFLHKLRDSLLIAASDLERGDEDAAAEAIENAVRDIRKELEEEAA